MMHHHHTLNGVEHHAHPEAFHIDGRHDDRPEWGPAHYGHNHSETVSVVAATPHTWTEMLNTSPIRATRGEWWPHP
jgi:hypothetical protein